jgi:hypothetical protein
MEAIGRYMKEVGRVLEVRHGIINNRVQESIPWR